MSRSHTEPNDNPLFRIATFNIRHGKGLDEKIDLDRIAAVLESIQADVIGLQEVDRFRRRSGYRDQVNELAARMEMYWCFSSSLRLGLSQYGNAILSKYPIAGANKISMPGQKEMRTILKAQVRTRYGLITVCNTHIGVSQKERQMQVPVLMEVLRQISGPAFVMGDFNMEKNDPLMAGIVHEWRKLCGEEKQATFVTGHEPDHLFTNVDVRDLKVWTIATEASDHYPLVAQFRWQGMRRFPF